jgi:hypothetical protein
MIPLVALALAGPVDLPLTEPSGARRALVIGVDDYGHGLRRLQHAVADAQDLGGRLARSDAGFEVVSLLGQVGRAELLQALDVLLPPPGGGLSEGSAGPDDVTVVYFAGHATLDAAGDLWWLLSDSDPADLAGTALPLREVQRRVTTGRPLRVALLVDACHDTGLTARSVSFGLPRLPRASGRNVFEGHAAEVGQRAWEDGELGHGLYTSALLDALDDSGSDWNLDGAIDVWEAHQVADVEVRQRSGGHQVPWYDQRRSGDDVIPLVGTPVAVPHAVLPPLPMELQWWVDRLPRGAGPVRPGRHRLQITEGDRTLCRFSAWLSPGEQLSSDPCAPASVGPELRLGLGGSYLPGQSTLTGMFFRVAGGVWLPVPGVIRSRVGVTLEGRAGGPSPGSDVTYVQGPMPDGALSALVGWSVGETWLFSAQAGPALLWRRLIFERQAAPAGALHLGVGWQQRPFALVFDGGLMIAPKDGLPWLSASFGLTLELRGEVRSPSWRQAARR